jgi:peptide/nickel transport system permease protein
LSIGYTTSGALLTEIMFSYPGLGQLFFYAIDGLDYTLLQGVFIVVSFTVLTAALALDLLYPLVDPRIR